MSALCCRLAEYTASYSLNDRNRPDTCRSQSLEPWLLTETVNGENRPEHDIPRVIGNVSDAA